MTTSYDTAPFPARLLIIDDIPENIGILFGLLSDQGHEVLIAEDGVTGLETAYSEQPDLILLDVMMPLVDGFEVCRRLKEQPTTQDIPVIFLTALSETHNKISGFQLGAVDYITKPLKHEEVLARVNTHLTVRRLQQQQQQYIEQLKERNAELDAFAHTVAHDLKNPLGVITGMSEMLCLQHRENAELLLVAQDIRNSGYKMRQIIDALLLLAKVSKQQFTLEVLDLNEIMQHVMQRIQPQLQEQHGNVLFPKQWPMVQGQPQWVEEVWINYLTNGLKYGGQPPRLEIGAQDEAEYVCFWVKDNGPGLSHEAQEKIFTPFTRLSHHLGEEGHGLGLSIVERIIKKLGGRVGVESQEGQGSCFFFTLPKAQDVEAMPVLLDMPKQADNVQATQIEEVTLPSMAYLEKLREAVILGDIDILQGQLKSIESQPTFKLFHQELFNLVQNMQIKKLRTVLEKYIANASQCV